MMGSRFPCTERKRGYESVVDVPCHGRRQCKGRQLRKEKEKKGGKQDPRFCEQLRKRGTVTLDSVHVTA